MTRPSLVPFLIRHTIVKNVQKASELSEGHVQLDYHVTTLLCFRLIAVILATVTMGE